MNSKFLKGTLILLATSVLLRGIGFVYQMLIVRFAGTEAVGILNMSVPFYSILLVMATAGMPVAIAKLTAGFVSKGEEAEIGRMMRTAFLLVGALSIGAFAAAVWVLPQVFSHLGTEARVAKCFTMLIPGLVIVPFCSVMRGYFQGMQQMQYPSLGQVAEQVIRVISGLVLVIWICPKDVTMLAMALAAAAMLGEAGGCLLLWFCYLYARRKQRQRNPESTGASRTALPDLLALGMPQAFTKLTSSVDMAIEASLVPFCLIHMGFNASQAAAVYGQFSGVAVSLITIPTVLTGALGTALIPAVSEADAGGRKKELEARCSQSVLITWMFSLPVILMLYAYGEELCCILFHIEGMGPMMRMLSFGAVFMYLEQTLVGILQGLGETKTVFVNNFWGSFSKLIGMYYGICILGWGSLGVAAGMVLGYGLQCLLNLAALSCRVKLYIKLSSILLPAAGSVLMLAAVKLIMLYHKSSLVLLAAMMAGGCMYLFFLFFTGQLAALRDGKAGAVLYNWQKKKKLR